VAIHPLLSAYSNRTLHMLTVDPMGVQPLEKFFLASAAECTDVFFWSSEHVLPEDSGLPVGRLRREARWCPHLIDAVPSGYAAISAGVIFAAIT
jgi:hypothetical protein